MLKHFIAAAALAAALASAAVAADTYKVDPAHSFVLFKVKHLNIGNAYGEFTDVSGTIKVDDDKPENGSIDITIKAESISTNVPKRDEHLRSPDFLNVKQFPVITFKSTSIKKSGEDTFEVTGDLQVHGVTKPVTTTFKRIGMGKDPWGKFRAGAEATFTIKRSEFDMKFMLDGVSDDVQITVALEAIKEG
jgi:polyisoprenoid-binding protein YceI